MSEVPDGERPATPADDAPDISLDEEPQVSALRPEQRAAPAFSMRRMLNAVSLVVGGAVLLALAIHWLPDVASYARSLRGAQQTPSAKSGFKSSPLTASNVTPPVRGQGWKTIGPDWATDIAFSADGSVGYACGSYPGKPIAFFASYHVTENTWETLNPPLAAPVAVDSCGVSVSPVDSADILLTIAQCLRCTGASVPTSLAYRSHDGGVTWKALDLPPATLIGNVAWTDRSTLFLVAEDTSAAGTTMPPTFTLLISHDDGRENGPLTEISAHSLGVFGEGIGSITLISSGVTVYALGDVLRCTQNCRFIAESSDEGRSWDRDFSNMSIQTVNVAAAQSGTDTLIGWTFESAVGAMFVQRSDDGGESWQALSLLPVNPTTGGATLFAAPNGAVYAFCYGQASVVYALGAQATSWQPLAALPDGDPLTMQYDAHGHAIALWGQGHEYDSGHMTPGLEYYPLPGNAP